MSTDTGTRGERITELGQIAAAALALGALVLFFHKTAVDLVAKWSDWTAYNHGFLIVPICLYLAWRERATAAATAVNPDWRGLAIVVPAVFAWVIGHATGTLVIQEVSLVTIVQGIVLTMYGWPMWRTFAFPLLYLYFVVPFGQGLVPRLQEITASLAVGLIKATGIPVFSDGDVITVPNGTFYVAAECSGVGFLVASIAVGALFAGITYRSWWRRIAFMALSIAVPIVANGVRAFGIILLAYATNNKLAAGVDHILYGWIFFSFTTFATLAVGMRFREKDEPVHEAMPAARRADNAKLFRRIALAGILALVPVAVADFYSAHMDALPLRGLIHLALPEAVEHWKRNDSMQDRLAPVFAAPDGQWSVSYEKGDARVFLHIGYFVRERRGAEAVSSDHDFGSGNGWVLADVGAVESKIGNDAITLQYVRSVKDEQKHVIWYWYWIDGRFTGNRILAKVLEAREKFLGGQDATAVIAIGTDYNETPADADRALRDFAANLFELRQVLNGP